MIILKGLQLTYGKGAIAAIVELNNKKTGTGAGTKIYQAIKAAIDQATNKKRKGKICIYTKNNKGKKDFTCYFKLINGKEYVGKGTSCELEYAIAMAYIDILNKNNLN